MNLLEQLETSYNRQVQKQIYEQLDRIDTARDLFLTEKYKHRLHFYNATKDLLANLHREKALMKGYNRDYRDALRNLHREFRNQLYEIKESRDFGIKENKQYVNLVMAKIDSNYRKARVEFLQAMKKGHPEAAEKLQVFETQFRAYRREELSKRLNEQKDKHDAILSDYQLKYQEFENKYREDKKNLIVKHHRLSRKEFRKEKLLIIASYQQQINYERKLMLSNEQKEATQKNELQRKYLQVKKDAQARIREINLEAKATVRKMRPEERERYQQLQKYIREDFRARKLKRLDEVETKFWRKLNPAYLYVFPAFFGEVLFTLLPFIFMIVGSLFRVNFANLSKSKFVGFDNFVNIFIRDSEFQKSLGNTAIYAFTTIVLLTVVTVSMAAWLAKNTRIHNFTQTMIFTPHIASLVSISILWIAMLNPTGVINQALALFGIKGPAWLLQENTSLFSVSLVTVWKDIGYYVLIIVSGLQGIPAYVYEAAQLDKASKTTAFFKITLPLLAPTMSFVFLTKFINSFKVFAPIEIMTNGGPMGSSMVLSYWVYKVGRIGFNYGNAMAGAIVLTLMIALCTLLKNIYFNKVTKY